MNNKKFVLGIDTSNYTSSVAAVSAEEDILCDERIVLNVEKGKRGLRQSDAFYMHMQNLPELVEKTFGKLNAAEYSLAAIAVSSKPRPVEGSYMPVFNSGISAARCLAAALNVELFEFSHQEGHMEAARYGTVPKCLSPFIFFHFSGGTTEALLSDLSIVGGTMDISYGQLIDRVGVAMGLKFPCGSAMDEMASSYKGEIMNLPKIKVKDGYMNLSGLETFCIRETEYSSPDMLSASIFKSVADSIALSVRQLTSKYGINDFLFAGGVSSSNYLRKTLPGMLNNVNIYFGKRELSSDNAVGTAFLGLNSISGYI